MYKPKRKKEDESGLINYFSKLDEEIDDVFGAIKKRQTGDDKKKDDKDDKDGKKDDKKDAKED